MKKILIIILGLIGFAQAQVNVAGYIQTNGVASYPTHIDSMGKGGYVVVYDTTQRNSITCLRRKFGMAVYTQKDTTLWILRDSSCNNNWIAFTSGISSVDSLVYATWRRLYKVNDSMKVVYSNLYGLNISNTNLRLTGNRSLSGGAGSGNGYEFTFDSTGKVSFQNKGGTKYFEASSDGELKVSNALNESFKIYNTGEALFQSSNTAESDMPTRVTLSAQDDTATFKIWESTRLQLGKVNPNNGSSYKILVRNDASNEVEYVDAVNVDTTVLATKAYVDYKDDIQQGFIDMRKLDSDTSRWKGYTTRERTQQQLDSTAALLARLAAVNIFTTRNTFNGALFGNKDSIPISTTNQWILAIDTVTGAITRINRIAAFVPNADTTITGNYTLTQRDLGRAIYCTNTSLITITIPTGLTTGITLFQDRRYNIGVYQEGTGNGLVQFAGSGVTLQSTEGATKTRVENSYAEIKFKSDTVVKLVGDII